MKVSGSGRVGSTRSCPTVGDRIVSAASVKLAKDTLSAPDDHFGPGPDCRVIVPGNGRVCGAGSRPTVSGRVVSSTGVQATAASESA